MSNISIIKSSDEKYRSHIELKKIGTTHLWIKAFSSDIRIYLEKNAFDVRMLQSLLQMYIKNLLSLTWTPWCRLYLLWIADPSKCDAFAVSSGDWLWRCWEIFNVITSTVEESEPWVGKEANLCPSLCWQFGQYKGDGKGGAMGSLSNILSLLMDRIRWGNVHTLTGEDVAVSSCYTRVPFVCRRYGVLGLYKGLEAKLLQTVLTAALMFVVYEKITAATFRVMGLKKKLKSWALRSCFVALSTC